MPALIGTKQERVKRDPLTPEQQAHVTQWLALGAKKAIGRSRGAQAADREDAIAAAWLQMCLSVRTFDAAKGAKMNTHLGNAAGFGALSEYKDRLRGGLGGDREATGRPTVVTVDDWSELDRGKVEGEMDEPATETQLLVRAAILALDTRTAYVVTLRHLCGWKLCQIAWHLNLSIERCRQISDSGLEQLRHTLKESA